jgi:hypothetical protein
MGINRNIVEESYHIMAHTFVLFPEVVVVTTAQKYRVEMFGNISLLPLVEVDMTTSYQAIHSSPPPPPPSSSS